MEGRTDGNNLPRPCPIAELCWSPASDDVTVLIGSENEHEEMNDVSLVVASYGRSDRAVGVVGVVGPTRMAYPHAISTVRYVRGLMNELVDHLYA